MKKLLRLSVVFLLLIACNTKKQVEIAVNSGNYDRAINTALDKLRKNKDKKRNYDYAIMLQGAYYKVVERDLENIAHLKKDNNPETFRKIYEMYLDLDARQNAIKPILPLKVNGKKIAFEFNNYSDDILDSKNKVSDYTYEKGLELLESDDKQIIREAYNALSYLERINPNYENTRELLDEAHQRGKDYILVTLNNDTQQIIPSRLEDDLLNFNTYGLNKFWSEYHVNKLENLNYDYAMQLNLKGIDVSPERISEREFIREKQVVDGWEYKKDKAGNAVKDSLGKYIKVDKLVDVKARFIETIQTKSSHVVGDVVYLDLKLNQLLDAFPIDSEFVFEYVFARYRGDKRALNANDIALLNNRRIPFPSNEQMVYDTGEDLKLQLKSIINSYAVR
ncbi:MAG: hypothetical protein P8K68_13960 [Algibacter sp.]|uniref:hypothetical protein n=1 Tax=Algibacter sp. TaxID=1872428 RepID=UPI0026250295|nr:hypothetical protein [Algibacter sp.]MDG1730768.1 hypothetical protein [Algibacter sp.]MDG2179870.1 hypothetical protein [Algibacter sp.]